MDANIQNVRKDRKMLKSLIYYIKYLKPYEF